MNDRAHEALKSLEDVRAERNRLREQMKALSEVAEELIVAAWNEGATVTEIGNASPFTHPWTSRVLTRAGVAPGTRSRRNAKEQ